MSRCKACDTVFHDSEFSSTKGLEEDLCSYCRFISSNPNYLSDKEYQFESITEIPVYVENYRNTVDKS